MQLRARCLAALLVCLRGASAGPEHGPEQSSALSSPQEKGSSAAPVFLGQQDLSARPYRIQEEQEGVKIRAARLTQPGKGDDLPPATTRAQGLLAAARGARGLRDA